MFQVSPQVQPDKQVPVEDNKTTTGGFKHMIPEYL